jgi:hypothetical protein
MRRSRAALPVDPFAAQVVFEAHFNGTHGQTNGYVAESGQAMNNMPGGSALSNVHAEVGKTTSFACFNTNLGSFPDNAAWDLAAGDANPYTIEWSHWLPNLLNTVMLLQPNWNIDGWMVRQNTTTMEFFWLDQAGVSRSITKAAAGFVSGAFQRGAITKDASRVLRFFLGGTKVHEATIPVGQGGIKPVTGPLLIGPSVAGLTAWLARTRFTTACRYTADYDASAVVFAGD